MSSKYRERLSADNATEITKSRRESFKKTAGVIRYEIDERIREAAKDGKQCIRIELPHTVFGHEFYDVVDMGRDIVEQLQADGYRCSGTYSRFIVRWGDDSSSSSSSKKRLSPIISSSSSSSPTTGKRSLINVPVPRQKV
jgi:hypothetical protein